MGLQRWFRHLAATPLATRRAFPSHVLEAIEKAITALEARHAGEIRFVIETALDLAELRAGITPRERALEVFGLLRVWDTADNNGVLIYLLMAEHDVEIIADRGIAARVSSAEWGSGLPSYGGAFSRGSFSRGRARRSGGCRPFVGTAFPGCRR